MKDFKTFLSDKSIKEDAFKEMDAAEQLKLQNEYNTMLKTEFETAIANKASKEDLDGYKASITKSNESVVKTIESLALTIKSMQEKGGKSPEEMTQPELVKLFESQSKNYDKGGQGNGKAQKATLKVNELFAEVNKAAALLTTANIIGVGNGASGGNAGQWSPLFGNYIDSTIYSAQKQVSSIMDDISVSTQPGTENIYWTERVNEAGDATWIAEGGLKPLIDAEWKTSTARTMELAERWKITTRFLFHVRLAVEDFAVHARELMTNGLAKGFLNGNGTAPQMNGIVTAASAWVTPPSGVLLNSTPCPNLYDAILALATQIRCRGFGGQIVARVPCAYSYALKTGKDSKGGYHVVPFASPDGKQVDDVLVKFDPNIASGSILVGVLYNYKGVISENSIYTEYLSGDDGDKNLLSRKLETFAQGYLPASLKGSIIFATLAEVLTDIDNGDDCCCTPEPA